MQVNHFFKYYNLLFALVFFVVSCESPPNDVDPTLTDVVDEQAQQAYPVEGYPASETILDAVLDSDTPPAEIPKFPGQIAFQTDRYGSFLQVGLLDGASGATSRLVQNLPQTFEPAWSSRCETLTFTVGQGDDVDFEIYRQNLGEEEAALFITHPEYYDWASAWSSTGIIAYQNNPNSLLNICFADDTGSDLRCMSQNGFSNAMPAWSSDGSQLVFGSNRDGNWEIYVTDYPAMSTVIRITDNDHTDYEPIFSPDGERILFSSQRGAGYDLYTIRLDGQDEKQLTNDGGDERNPAWVGTEQIVYSSGIQDDTELYLMNADGSDPQRLTYSPGRDEWPVWCAVP